MTNKYDTSIVLCFDRTHFYFRYNEAVFDFVNIVNSLTSGLNTEYELKDVSNTNKKKIKIKIFCAFKQLLSKTFKEGQQKQVGVDINFVWNAHLWIIIV